ncbi:MAG TPA: hypothetical protein PLG94_14960 [Smithellaceae bacterium]|nr:hypothetical protein [Smithellaceae bacterium]
MINSKDINIRMLIHVAKRLGDLREKEDIITVIDGRPEIVSEILISPDDLKNYLAAAFRTLLRNSDFLSAIPGHLLPDRTSQARLPRLKKCLELIAKIQDPT